MARNRSIQKNLDKFLDQETFALTVSGTLSRNRIYCCQDDKKRRDFRKSLRGCLNSLLEEYQPERGKPTIATWPTSRPCPRD